MRPSQARKENFSVAPICRSKGAKIIAIATDIESSSRRLSPRRPVCPSASLGRGPCRELPRETPGSSATKPTTWTLSMKACLRVRHQADSAQPARTQAQDPGWTQQRRHSKQRKVERLFALMQQLPQTSLPDGNPTLRTYSASFTLPAFRYCSSIYENVLIACVGIRRA